MQTSYAQQLKDLAHQYNTGRISLQQFRAQRRDLLTSAQAQLLPGQARSAIDAQQNPPRS
jgi:hypothetical protein